MHVALVAPHYFVGSFDDDASYILTAKGLLSGAGLTGRLPSGETVVGLYPPGYSALLVPLVWLWPHSFVPLRLLSTVCFAAVFPLTWLLLRRRGVSATAAMAALLVMALGPPFATYGSMVMAEAPFLVALLLLLLSLDRWREDPRALTRWGLAAVVLAAGLIWLKEAGLGLVVGLVLWLPFTRTARRWTKAAVLAGGVAATLVPVVVARLSAGVPLAGSRYSQELGGYYQGGLLKRVVDVVPGSTWHLLSTAIPATLVPYLEPLPISGAWAELWKVISWQVTLLALVGAVVWFRRHRDEAVPMTVVYLGESVLWPFVNERRAILVLPLLVAWYVTGAREVWVLLRRRVGSPRAALALRSSTAVVAVLVVAAPLVAQMPRDYLYGWGQSGSHFGGSRYAAVLRALGRPSDVVETDYRSSTALFTGHTTNWTAFTGTYNGTCYGPSVLSDLNADHAGFLLLGDLNKPGQLDSPCLQSQALLASWAVQILHTTRDNASVYELIGPYTGHPDLVDILSRARAARYSTAGGVTTVYWKLPAAEPVSQLSVGQAAVEPGATADVRVELQSPDGTWRVMAESHSGVGDGKGMAPFLLAEPAQPQLAVGVRVVVQAAAPGAGAVVSDVVALGPRHPTP